VCGIVGAFGSWLLDSQKERFKELLTVSNLRGFQGAGAIVTDNKCNVEVFKTVHTGTHLAHDPDFNHRLYHKKPPQSTSVLIGHTRWPTKGAVTLEATHPHSYDGFTGVHNGTIDSINGVHIGPNESDSFLLYKSFAENGVADTIKETRGAYCCVWIDEKERTLNFLRNDKRPMYFAEMAGGGETFFASERGMLDFVLGRQSPKFTVTQLVVDKWAVWELPLKPQLARSLVEVTELKGKAAPAVAGYAVPFRHWTGTTPAISEGEKTSEGSSEKPTGHGAVTPSGVNGQTSMQTTTSLTGVKQSLIPPPSMLSRLSPPITDKTKPRMRWDNTLQTWVEVLPLTTVTSSQAEANPTKHGGSPDATNSNVVKLPESRKESQSTEGNFPVDLLADDGQMVGERDFSNLMPDDGTIKEQIDKLFPPTLFEGYRETITGNWMAEEQYITTLGKGCLWCGDPQPDNESVTWTDVDEFMCETCVKDPFGKDYVDLCLGLVNDPEDAIHDKRQIA